MAKHKESKSFGNPAQMRGNYTPPNLTLEERVTNLESQLQVILEIVRSLENQNPSAKSKPKPRRKREIPDNIQIESIFKD